MSVQRLTCSQFDLKAAASAGRARNCLKTVFFDDERIFLDESSCYIEFVQFCLSTCSEYFLRCRPGTLSLQRCGIGNGYGI